MKTKCGTVVLQKGSVAKVTEYELRLINKDGDAFDIHHGETLDEVKRYGLPFSGEAVAYVVELHVSYHPERFAPRNHVEYRTVETGGDREALLAGEWITEDGTPNDES